jgi:hypothetical protein
MTFFHRVVPAALVVALAFAGALAACASLVGVQDGVLEEAGADGTTEAALAETGADVTPDTASEATSDAKTRGRRRTPTPKPLPRTAETAPRRAMRVIRAMAKRPSTPAARAAPSTAR